MCSPFTSWLPLLLLILPLIFLSKRKSPTKLPPGPPRLPIIGSIGMFGNINHRTLWQLSRKYGPLVYLKLGSLPALVVSSAKLASDVMKTQDLDFCNRPPFVSCKKLSYDFADIGFAPYGDGYRERRKVCNNELLSLKKVHSFGFIREEEVARMIASISSCASPSKPANLTGLMLSLTSTVVARAAFGKSYTSGGDGKADFQFHGIFKEAQELLGAFFVGDYFPWLGWMDTVSGQRARLEKVFWKMDAFYEQVIEEHLDSTKQRPRPKEETEDLADVLIRVQKELNLTRSHIKALFMVTIPSFH